MAATTTFVVKLFVAKLERKLTFLSVITVYTLHGMNKQLLIHTKIIKLPLYKVSSPEIARMNVFREFEQWRFQETLSKLHFHNELKLSKHVFHIQNLPIQNTKSLNHCPIMFFEVFLRKDEQNIVNLIFFLEFSKRLFLGAGKASLCFLGC